jgi:hypothetical protein
MKVVYVEWCDSYAFPPVWRDRTAWTESKMDGGLNVSVGWGLHETAEWLVIGAHRHPSEDRWATSLPATDLTFPLREELYTYIICL